MESLTNSQSTTDWLRQSIKRYPAMVMVWWCDEWQTRWHICPDSFPTLTNITSCASESEYQQLISGFTSWPTRIRLEYK